MATIEIPLTRGKVALIDEEDFPLVSKHRWYTHRTPHSLYARTKITRNETESMHRLILGLNSWELVADHRDGNGLNNTRANLRTATRLQNSFNVKKNKGRSRFKGVFQKSDRSGWLAAIKRGGVRTNLGRFTDEVEAALAYDNAARELFGEFAKLNFPNLSRSGAVA